MNSYDEAYPFDKPFPPEDLARYYKEVHPDIPGQPMHIVTPADGWGFVCPACKCIFRAGFAGMPGSFRTHVQEYEDTGGCFFHPPRKGRNAHKPSF